MTEVTNQPSAIIDLIASAPGVVIPLVREMPADLLKRRPAPDKWSVHEHACHLTKVHDLFLKRLDLMLSEPEPAIRPYNPEDDEAEGGLLAMDLEEALATYARNRAELVARLRTLTPADWQRTGRHGQYNRYSVLIMFRHVALHDYFHAYRIEDLVLSKGWAE